jgi:hypothetical protein
MTYGRETRDTKKAVRERIIILIVFFSSCALEPGLIILSLTSFDLFSRAGSQGRHWRSLHLLRPLSGRVLSEKWRIG